MVSVRFDDDEQDGEVFIDSVDFSDAIDYVIAQHIQGEWTAEQAETARNELGYSDDAPMKLYVGYALVDDKDVPFRLTARSPLEAKFAAKRYFGEVPVSVGQPRGSLE